MRPTPPPLEVPMSNAESPVPHTPTLATDLARAGVAEVRTHGDVMPPLHLSSNYTFAGIGEPRRFDYTRSGNPSRALLLETLARAEGAAGGVVTASGMAAVAVACRLFPAGHTLLTPVDGYGGTRRLLDALHRRGELRVVTTAASDDALVVAIRRHPGAAVWVETPTNPHLRVVDLPRIARVTHEHGGVLVVDNTFLTPAGCRPIALGADLVVHSTTKAINGHSDVVGGAVLARKEADAESLAWWANALGCTGSPFDAWLTLRGLRTLPLRLAAQERTALELAQWLEAHPAVRRVSYPGLPSHPGHVRAAAQQSSFGLVVTFELAGGVAGVRTAVERLRHFTLAESLGGVESLVCHPATMTHACLTESQRADAGIGPGLVRLSIGIESAADLRADLDAALQAATALTVRATARA